MAELRAVLGGRAIPYAILVLATAALSYAVGFEPRQILAVGVFGAIIYGALLFWKFRLAFALFGLAGMLAINVIDIDTIIDNAGLDIVLFLIGMMILIGFLEERKFFEHIVEIIVSRAGTGRRLAVVLMLLAALFAALVDEVTSILFMAATVFHLAAKKGQPPVPLLVMVIFATNIGSSATVVGNPVGVMIALRGDLTFADFLRWATPIALLALLVAIPISLAYFRKDVKALDEALRASRAEPPPPQFVWTRDLQISALLFVGTLVGLVLHSQVEASLGLKKNSMLLGTALIAAGISIVIDRKRARDLVERRVDWWTLLFFLTLFASVGALRIVGVTARLAAGIADFSGGNPGSLFVSFTWVTGVLSAFMDNVLAVAMFTPVALQLGGPGPENPLWWSMLFAGTFFGNLTMIGSTANIVAIGMLERRKLGHITFWEWFKPGALVSLPTLALATLLLYAQFYV